MKTMFWRRWLSVLLIGAGGAGPVAAEQTVRSDPWVLHYMTMNTTELTPEVARAYGVRRSKARGLLMLNLQHQDQPVTSVDHRSEGVIRNLIGQTLSDPPRRVEQGGAIYSLVEFRYSHLETLRFDYTVYPQPDSTEPTVPVRLQFNQQFFTPGR
ncbi:MAG: DUF4426 domain-containing protein [Oceanococcaceae bacterium]